MEQENQIKDMATIATSIASIIKQKLKGKGNPTSTGLYVQDGTRPPINLSFSNEA